MVEVQEFRKCHTILHVLLMYINFCYVNIHLREVGRREYRSEGKIKKKGHVEYTNIQ